VARTGGPGHDKVGPISAEVRLRVLATILPGEDVIELVHSLATYGGAQVRSRLKGQVIGFVGDRTQNSEHQPVVIKKEKAFKWNKEKEKHGGTSIPRLPK